MVSVRSWVAAAAAALVVAAPAQAGAPAVSAQAFFVENPATGEVLAQKGAWAKVPIASITKLMTVLVTLDRAKWGDVVRIRPGAATVGESTVNLRTGERLTVGDLVKAALIQSANDAADALALHVGKGNRAAFVTLMNAKARELGLERTHFATPDGLDTAGNYSTAFDVTKLAQAAMQHPEVRSVVRLRTGSIAGGRTLHTWNDLLGVFPGIYGVKTGHTGGAGWCEVAAVKRNGVTLYTTVLGSPTRSQRNADLASLLRWGIARYRPVWLVAPGRAYVHARVGYGKKPVALVAAKGLASPVRIDRPLVERVVAPSAVDLPVRAGQRLGEVRVYSGRRLIARRALVADRSVAEPSFGGKVGFYAGRTVHHIGDWFT
jgi:serine-type D-Ala-D-Ala carboxypeptidase (penicillin-binding protein 5/6)